MGYWERRSQRKAERQARELFGNIAEPGESFLGSVPGTQTVFNADYAQIPARLLLTDRASYFASDVALFRAPHDAVARLNDSWGAVCEMAFFLRPEVEGLYVVPVGSRTAYLMSFDEFDLARPGEHGGGGVVGFHPTENDVELRRTLREHVRVAGGVAEEIVSRSPFSPF